MIACTSSRRVQLKSSSSLPTASIMKTRCVTVYGSSKKLTGRTLADFCGQKCAQSGTNDTCRLRPEQPNRATPTTTRQRQRHGDKTPGLHDQHRSEVGATHRQCSAVDHDLTQFAATGIQLQGALMTKRLPRSLLDH